MDLTCEPITDNLNEELEHEYRTVMAYISHSRLLKGAQCLPIADDREIQAHAALRHALTICKQVGQLEGDPLLESNALSS